MALKNEHVWLLAIAAVLRLAIFAIFPGLADLLANRVEISTPVTSFKRLQEGVFLFCRGISPYDGGVFHQSPILLALDSVLPTYNVFPQATQIVYILADLLSAEAIIRLVQSGESTSTRLFTSTRKSSKASDTAVAAAYLFNPLTVATCLGRPTSVFTNTAIFQTVAAAAAGDIVGATYGLALASYLSGYMILLTPPIALLTYDAVARKTPNEPKPLPFYLQFGLGLTAGIVTLLLLSWFLTDFNWQFLTSTYGVQLLLTDLTPNIGLWWYFFIEMFDSFRNFFLGVFWLHMSSYVGALTIRIRKQPLFVVTSLLGIFAIFKPYPSIADVSVYFALLPLYRHVLPLLRYGFIATAALLYATFLGPAFWHLWIYAGSGNANFFYAITLVWSLGLSIIVADSIYAINRDELDVERPELQGREVKQI